MKKYFSALMAVIFCFSTSVTAFAAHDFTMSFLFGGTSNQYYQYIERSNGAINSVSIDYFTINQNGGLHHNNIDRNFIKKMHDKDIKVIPFISNNWSKELGLAAIKNTDNLTTEIAEALKIYDLDGVNVDIENISHEYKDDYTNFVKTLRDKIPDKMITVSVAANPENWKTGWHGSYDYKKLAEYSDYLIIIGYDESFTGGKPGPVASGDWTENAIKHALKYTTADKLVLGIPSFGRYWKKDQKISGNAIAAIDIKNLKEIYNTKSEYDKKLKSAKITLTLKEDDLMPKLWGGKVLTPGEYEIWYDDENALQYKLELIDKYNLRGSGMWALGQEIPEMWERYKEYKKDSGHENPAKSDQKSSTVNDTVKSVMAPYDTAIMPDTVYNTASPDKNSLDNTSAAQKNRAAKSDSPSKNMTMISESASVITSISENEDNAANESSITETTIISVNSSTQTQPSDIAEKINSQSGDIVLKSWTNKELYQNDELIYKTEEFVYNKLTDDMPQESTTEGEANESSGHDIDYTDKNALNADTDINANKSGIVTTSGMDNTVQNNIYRSSRDTNPGNNLSFSNDINLDIARANDINYTTGNYRNNEPAEYDDHIAKSNHNDIVKRTVNRGWFSESEFESDKILTKSQAVKILMRMAANLPEPSDEYTNFKDVKGHADEEFILKAKYYGILDGSGTDKFNADQPIRKGDLAVYIDRLFSLPDTVDFESDMVKDIVKESDIEEYYAINKYFAHGIFDLDEKGNFYPDDTLTMGEMAEIADKLYGAGIKDLEPILSSAQKQKQKYFEAR